MLRQIEWRLQNKPTTKSGVLQILEPLKKSQFDVPSTQRSIFVFFVSAGV